MTELEAETKQAEAQKIRRWRLRLALIFLALFIIQGIVWIALIKQNINEHAHASGMAMYTGDPGLEQLSADLFDKGKMYKRGLIICSIATGLGAFLALMTAVRAREPSLRDR